MKIWTKLFAVLALVAMTAACADESESVEKNTVAQNVKKGRPLVIDCGFATSSRGGSRAAMSGGVISDVAPAKLSADTMQAMKDLFLTEFPAGQKNLNADHSALKGFSSDFSLVSTGKTITMYPVLVGGNARNTVGVYWYEGDEMKTQDLWALVEDGVIGNEKNGWAKLQDGSGINITIPAGCVYGFYITNQHKDGTAVGGQPFYTDASKNVGQQLHAVIYSKDERSYIGFEDLDLRKSNCDKDYNDVILMFTPELTHITTDIIVDTDEPFLCQSDDFNINLGDDGYVAIPCGAAEGASPFDFDGTMYITNYDVVLNSAGQLVFKIRLYKGDGPWPNDTWYEAEPYCLSEDIDFSKVKGGPDGFKLAKARKVKGYEGQDVPYLQIDLIYEPK